MRNLTNVAILAIAIAFGALAPSFASSITGSGSGTPAAASAYITQSVGQSVSSTYASDTTLSGGTWSQVYNKGSSITVTLGSGKLTVGTTGVYLLTVGCYMGGSGNDCLLGFIKNGGASAQNYQEFYMPGANNQRIGAAWTVALTSGDYIQLVLRQNSGSSRTVQAEMTLTLIGTG